MADSTTSNIDEFLKQIQSAIYGEEVRSAIHDSIKQCYTDGKSFKKVEILDADDPTTGYLRGHLILTRIDDVTYDCGMALGEKGDTGTAITKAEISNDILYLTMSDGTVYNLGRVVGERGAMGSTPYIEFKVVTDDDPNHDASITRSGTAGNPIFTLSIPRGKQGTGSVSTVDGLEPSDSNVQLSAVRYAAQTLTDDQRKQALTNLGVQDKQRYLLTLAADSWVGTEAPYTYTIEFTDAVREGDAIVGMAATVTAEQYTAFCNARMMATGFANKVLTITAFDAKPDIDLPINFIVMPYLYGTETVTTVTPSSSSEAGTNTDTTTTEEVPDTTGDDTPVIDESSGGEETDVEGSGT